MGDVAFIGHAKPEQGLTVVDSCGTRQDPGADAVVGLGLAGLGAMALNEFPTPGGFFVGDGGDLSRRGGQRRRHGGRELRAQGQQHGR